MRKQPHGGRPICGVGSSVSGPGGGDVPPVGWAHGTMATLGRLERLYGCGGWPARRFDLVGPAHGTMATHALTIRCDRSDTTAPAGGAGKAPAGRRRAGVARVGVRSGATMLPR